MEQQKGWKQNHLQNITLLREIKKHQASCKNLFYMLHYIVAVKFTVPVVKYFSRIVAQILQAF